MSEELVPPQYRKCPRCGSIMMGDPYPGFCMNCALMEMKNIKKVPKEESWNPSERVK